MDIRVTSGEYKSIKPPLDWLDIPSFAALSGLNGAGKTQLLEVVFNKVHSSRNPNKEFASIQIEINDEQFSPDEIMFIPSMGNRLGNVQLGFNSITDQVTNYRNRMIKNERGNDPYEIPLFQRFSGSITNQGSMFPDDFYHHFFFYSNPQIIEQSVAKHFLSYRLRYLEMRESDHDHEECISKLGQRPWEIFNDLLENSGIKLKLVDPTTYKLAEAYRLEFFEGDSQKRISLDNLSTGQSTIVRLLFWFFAANEQYKFPRLLLLDEPDSHLHPSLIKMFVATLKDGLVDTLGCRVIMTTHRSETIAFVPEDSLFEMHPDAPRIRESSGAASTISLMSGNLVALVQEERPVFVEDEDDVSFYSLILDQIIRDEDWAGIRPKFVAASDGQGKNRTSGGREKVRKWVSKLNGDGMGAVRGLIDLDEGNRSSNSIVVLDRYSIENYLLDPINIFAFLLDRGLDGEFDFGTKLRIGEESKIRLFDSSELQHIADLIIEKIQENLKDPPTEDELERGVIEYTNGSQISVPRWLLRRKGGALVGACHGLWKGIGIGELIKSQRKVGLVPKSLKEIIVETSSA